MGIRDDDTLQKLGEIQEEIERASALLDAAGIPPGPLSQRVKKLTRRLADFAGPRPRPAWCPEAGGPCVNGCAGAWDCWAKRAQIANEPEGRTTGLHRDSMG